MPQRAMTNWSPVAAIADIRRAASSWGQRNGSDTITFGNLHISVDCPQPNAIADWRPTLPADATKGKVMSLMSSLGYSARAAAGAPEGAAHAESETGQAELTITQMSRLYSVSLRTLRFYEGRGLIKPRREGNARFYRAADLVRMEMILRGKKLGFTLTEINDLIGGKGANETPDLEEQLQPHQIVSQIGFLELQRNEIDSAIQRLRATHNYLSQGAM